jgi:type IV secretory pathway VirB2 component (pilin)
MTIVATIRQASLTDPPPGSAITSAASWITDLLFGPLAIAVAVIAVAWVGFAMLSGRIEIRRGLAVVIGCFILFGARGIADGLRSTATSNYSPLIDHVSAAPDFTHVSPLTNPPIASAPPVCEKLDRYDFRGC